jgi:hypothetical protein
LISDNFYMSVPEWFLFLYFKYWYFRSLKRFWDCHFNFVNVLELWRTDKWYIKRVLIWRFTLVLIKINYGQIGDQTGLFYTTNPVFYTSGNRFVHRTGTFGNLWFFHLSRQTTVIQDLFVRRQFSLVLDNQTNVNVEAWSILLPLGQSINHDNAIYISNYCIISTHNPQNCRKKNWYTCSTCTCD